VSRAFVCSSVTATTALAIVLAAPAALAQGSTERVVTKGGATYQGSLVEKLPGDHVTIQLVTGQVKRFEWSEIASAADASPSVPPGGATSGGELPVSNDAASLLLGRGASTREPLSHVPDGPLVDWPEPDRTAPTLMSSRLSVGMVGGISALGYGAVALEYYPWDEKSFTIGLRAAFGPAGALGPSVAEMLSIDWPMATWLQQGLGVGLTHSFHTGATATDGPDLPGSETFLDGDCTHFAVFFSRTVMLRATFGWSFPVTAGTPSQCHGPGSPCGRQPAAGLLATGGLFWNFDIGAGER
jgi:hypothetical protein